MNLQKLNGPLGLSKQGKSFADGLRAIGVDLAVQPDPMTVDSEIADFLTFIAARRKLFRVKL